MTGFKDIMLVLQLVLASALMWATFCRLVKTDGETYREARWAILFLFVAAGILLGAPFLPMLMPNSAHWEPWSTPEWCWFILLLATLIEHLVLARAWRSGHVPEGLKPRRAGASNMVMPVLVAVLTVVAAYTPQVHAKAQAQAPAQEVAGDVAMLSPGQALECLHPTGCVGMTYEAFAVLLQAAQQAQVQAPCRRQSLTL